MSPTQLSRKSAISLAVSLAVIVVLAGATCAWGTAASTEVNLRGGDRLQANAWHCSVYLSGCSWATSSKLLGTHPRQAAWIQNTAEIQAHGPMARITLGMNSNVEITFSSSTRINTRWRNTRSWIADSHGKVNPSLTTTFVSVRSQAVAQHQIFGNPSVTAYAGAV